MPITEQEKLGIIDFLVSEEQNIPILFQVARSVTKNICEVTTVEEALEYINVQIADTLTLLNKRPITKELLFKYLHQRKISVNADFTKGALVSKIIEYWNSSAAVALTSSKTNLRCDSVSAASTGQFDSTAAKYDDSCDGNELDNSTAQYPIHALARKFSEWFFNNYNDHQLKVEDFWSDARLQLRIAASDQINDYESAGANDIIQNLMRSKLQFDFYFNPNLAHAGVQGRMNVHGLILVLSCGTLHTQQNCVGVFECTFGLLRDPFAENNWKVKTMQCVLRSQVTPIMPSLCESDTMKESLQLPIPEGELT